MMTKRSEAQEIARGWQRAVDLARLGDLTEAQVHTLKAEICERANVVLHKEQAFIAQVPGEIHQVANGEKVNFASRADYLDDWIKSKELTAARSTTRRYGDTVKTFLAHLLAVANVEWRGMILIAACHGLRIGDAARLTWGHIDMERRSFDSFRRRTGRRGGPPLWRPGSSMERRFTNFPRPEVNLAFYDAERYGCRR